MMNLYRLGITMKVSNLSETRFIELFRSGNVEIEDIHNYINHSGINELHTLEEYVKGLLPYDMIDPTRMYFKQSHNLNIWTDAVTLPVSYYEDIGHGRKTIALREIMKIHIRHPGYKMCKFKGLEQVCGYEITGCYNSIGVKGDLIL